MLVWSIAMPAIKSQSLKKIERFGSKLFISRHPAEGRGLAARNAFINAVFSAVRTPPFGGVVKQRCYFKLRNE